MWISKKIKPPCRNITDRKMEQSFGGICNAWMYNVSHLRVKCTCFFMFEPDNISIADVRMTFAVLAINRFWVM